MGFRFSAMNEEDEDSIASSDTLSMKMRNIELTEKIAETAQTEKFGFTINRKQEKLKDGKKNRSR